ncbi:MAG TPA: ROK family protein [Firmicutes bacterium]|nr:ROK family protein [Bacillota bacterium]
MRMNGTEAQVYNRMLVLATLRNCAGRSRANIARLTGLSPTATTNIVNDLLDEGLLLETEKAKQEGRGRKGRMVAVNPNYAMAIGVEVTDRQLYAVLVDFAEQPVHVISRDVYQADASDLLNIIVAAVTELQTAIPRATKRPGVCLAVQGASLNFPVSKGWRLETLAGAVEERVGMPVYAQVRMLAATTAELRYGYGRDVTDFVYFNSAAGSGFGIGIVADGRLVRGIQGFSGQFGHLCVKPDGPQCYCGGRGCLAAIAAPNAILTGIRRAIDSGVETSLANIDRDSLQFSDVVDAAKNGDKPSIYTLENVGEALGLGFSYVINMLNPQLVVLSGVLAQAGDLLMLPIIRATRLHTVPALYKQVQFVLSELNEYGGARGAVACLMDRFFDYGTAQATGNGLRTHLTK